jgi:hypothetical protein
MTGAKEILVVIFLESAYIKSTEGIGRILRGNIWWSEVYINSLG